MLEIKNGMFCDSETGRFPLFLFNRDRDETKMPHNAVMYGVSGIKGKNCPWDDNFNLKPSWKEKCRGDLRSFKMQGIYVIIQPFSALWFRKQASKDRPTGIEDTIWWLGELDTSRKFFFQQRNKQQRELFKFMIDFCQTIKLKFAFSLLWEAQTIAWYTPSFIWFRSHREWLRDKYGNNFPVGYHTHNAKQSKLADFLSLEGNGIDELIHEPGNKPVIYFGKNPGRWPVGKPERYEIGYNTDKLIPFAKKETINELIRYGCSAKLYDRWLIEKELKSDLPDGFDLSKYNFREVNQEMRIFYGIIVDRLKAADRTKITNLFCLDLIEEIDTTPEPKPIEDIEDIEEKTEPAPIIVEPEVKENKMSNTEYWRHLARTWPDRWWHKLIALPVGLLVAILIQVGVASWWWMPIATIALAFIDGTVERRKMKEDKVKYQFLSSDGSEGEILEPYAKTPVCPE